MMMMMMMMMMIDTIMMMMMMMMIDTIMMMMMMMMIDTILIIFKLGYLQSTMNPITVSRTNLFHFQFLYVLLQLIKFLRGWNS